MSASPAVTRAAQASARSAAAAAAPVARRSAARPLLQRRGPSVATAAGVDAISTISQAATLATLAYGAYMVLSQDPFPEQDASYEQREPCPTCGGSGYEACLCTRWSDGDVGCSSCSKTGYMRCRNCGGGGTARPLLVKVRKSEDPRL